MVDLPPPGTEDGGSDRDEAPLDRFRQSGSSGPGPGVDEADGPSLRRPRPSVTFDTSTLLQVLILSIGIYLLLAFLRSTRGSGLVRGLGLMLIVGVYGLWGVADALEWFELKLVIQGFLGFVFVILAIVFQPELRRGIVSLGENPLLSRLLRRQHKDVVAEVVHAAISMAKKKQGALIAFERKIPLDAYVEGGVKLDAEANRYLLDSLFHHGNVLHDGAVIVRGDRVVAAACLFPLTENLEISKSTGTRHRAALGLTEETDAVTLTVSEETGRISIFGGGRMDRGVARKNVEAVLQQHLGMADGAAPEEQGGEPEAERGGVGRFLKGLFTEHLGQKFGALVLAALVFYGAHQDLRFQRDKSLRVQAVVGEPGAARPGELLVVLEPGWRLDGAPDTCNVLFEGTRDQLDVVAQLGGIVRVTEDQRAITLQDIDWVPPLGPGLDPSWPDGKDLDVEVIGLGQVTIKLQRDMVEVVTGDLDPKYEALADQLRFHPDEVTLRGPQAALDGVALKFEDVVLGLGDTFDVDRTVALARELTDRELEIVEQVSVTFPVVLREEQIGKVQVPITLQQYDKTTPHDFLPPGKTAEFEVFGRGLLPGDATEEERISIKTFVEDNLKAFIWVDDIPPNSTTGTVTSHGLDDWRDKLAERIDDLPAEADLRVELLTEPEIVLTKKE